MGARTRGIVVLLGVALAASTAFAATRTASSTLAGTRACLSRKADSVAGLPPATPPKAPALFFAAPRGKPLGVWSGTPSRGYDGIFLAFYASAAAAQKAYDPASPGKVVRNVVATWDGKRPAKGFQTTVLGCLRSGTAPTTKHKVPAASLATFAGLWDGHTRGLSITAKGGGGESANAGCCNRIYQLAFEIRSVTGTLTHATAVFRVTSYKRYDSSAKAIHVGETGKLQLRSGIVTDTLTSDFFCSQPAWDATGACGA